MCKQRGTYETPTEALRAVVDEVRKEKQQIESQNEALSENPNEALGEASNAASSFSEDGLRN